MALMETRNFRESCDVTPNPCTRRPLSNVVFEDRKDISGSRDQVYMEAIRGEILVVHVAISSRTRRHQYCVMLQKCWINNCDKKNAMCIPF